MRFHPNALPKDARQAKRSSRPLDSFLHSLESEVPAVLALYLAQIETAAVVHNA